MNFIKTDIPEVIIIEPKVFGDERGYFVKLIVRINWKIFSGLRSDLFRIMNRSPVMAC